MNRRQAVAMGGVAVAATLGGLGWSLRRRAPTDPAFWTRRFATPDGAELALSSLRGRRLLLNFWATWCPPCVEEMPELSTFDGEFRDRGLRIVGIGIDSAANISQFSRKTPMSYPLVVAGTSGLELVRRLGNTAGALPFTVVVGRDGRIAWRTLGRFKAAELREAVLRVL